MRCVCLPYPTLVYVTTNSGSNGHTRDMHSCTAARTASERVNHSKHANQAQAHEAQQRARAVRAWSAAASEGHLASNSASNDTSTTPGWPVADDRARGHASGRAAVKKDEWGDVTTLLEDPRPTKPLRMPDAAMPRLLRPIGETLDAVTGGGEGERGRRGRAIRT